MKVNVEQVRKRILQVKKGGQHFGLSELEAFALRNQTSETTSLIYKFPEDEVFGTRLLLVIEFIS